MIRTVKSTLQSSLGKLVAAGTPCVFGFFSQKEAQPLLVINSIQMLQLDGRSISFHLSRLRRSPFIKYCILNQSSDAIVLHC